MVKILKPSFVEERQLAALGYQLIAGVDEVGRGALAGPVVAAAVILPFNLKARWKNRVRDSKQLTGEERESLFPYIKEVAISTGVGTVSHEMIDRVGIAKATRRAMKLAIDQLTPSPQYLLVDFSRLPEVSLPQKGVVDGDSLCFSIACASIIAKVFRDRLMVALDAEYPGYGLADHKGYGTAAHLACLQKLGPCAIHRHSFQPVKDAIRLI